VLCLSTAPLLAGAAAPAVTGIGAAWWLTLGGVVLASVISLAGWQMNRRAARRAHQIASLLRGIDCLLWEATVRRADEGWHWHFSLEPTALSRRLFGPMYRPQDPGIWNQFAIPEWTEMGQRSSHALAQGLPGYEQQFHFEEHGRTTWLHESVSIRPDGPDQFHLIGLVTDITRQREAEDARQHSEERVRQLLARADCMLWEARVTADDAGELHWEWFVPQSELYRRLTGDSQTPARMPWTPAMVPEFDELQIRSRRAMLQGLPGYEQEFRVVLNNSVRWMHEQVAVKALAPGHWQLEGVVIDITAQRQAEESKRASEAQLRQVMDTADFLLWHARVFISPQGQSQWVLNVPSSTLYRRLFGREPEHPIALPWNELVTRETFEAMERRSQHALVSGADGYEQEFPAQRGQQQFWLREQATIRYVAPGEWQVVGIITDVTTHHAAEAARQASERALHEILERVGCLLWRATVVRHGDELEWGRFDVPQSRLRTQLLGDQAPTGAVQLWTHASVPELAELNLRSSRAIMAGEPGYEQEFRVVQGGHSRWLHEQVSIVAVAPNEWRTLGVVTDVTQRHEALEAQRRSEVRLEELLQRADCLIWQAQIVENAGQELVWRVYVPRSRLFRRIYGRDPDETGFEWHRLNVPEHAQMLATCEEALRADTGGYEQVFHVPRGEGDIWLTEQVTIVRRGPAEWEAVGVITDITARREAEEARRATEAQLRPLLELADCMVWQADVTETEGGEFKWDLYSPHSVLHDRLFGGDDASHSIEWQRLDIPERLEMAARADRAIRQGDSGYEQEFRVVYPVRVLWLREVVTITRPRPGHHRLVGVVTDITAQREAQEAYRASVAQVEQMLANADCMLWQARVFSLADGGMRWVMFLPRSRLHRELFGRDPINPPGIPWRFVVDPATEAEINRRSVSSLLAGKTGYDQEFHAQREGRMFWLHERASITPIAPGEWKVVGVITDITGRREAEQAVRASEFRYRTLYQHTPVAILEQDFVPVGRWLESLRARGVTDLSAWLDEHPRQILHAGRMIRFVDCNDAAMQMLRARTKNDFRRRRGVLTTPDVVRLVRSAMLALWEGRNTFEAGIKMRDFEGGMHDLNVRWWTERHERGVDFRQAVMVLVDLTELKRAEAALAAEKERLAVTLRAMAEGVITTDVAGRVQFMNPAAVGFTSIDAQSAIGRPVGEVYALQNDRTGEPVEVPVARVARGDVVLDLPPRTRLSSADGSSRLVEGCCAPIHASDSRVVGMVLVFRDVTEQERLEQELVRATKLESVGILAGGIAHDFNNILTAVMGNVALAALDIDANSEAGRSLREAEKATLRARDLTQQLLTFAKGGEPVRTAVQLDAIVREVVTFTLHGAKVRAEYDLPAELWPADADKGQISRVVQNLVLNAVQAMPEGGVIKVRLRNERVDALSRLSLAPGPYIQIAIADTGVGIRPEHLPRIFDPYFTTKQKGSGLGLAAVYSIVNKHRGLIDVESHLGAGTTFRIWLPASAEAAAEAGEDRRPAPPAAMQGRVLFMDDEESIRQMATFLLRRFGFEVVCAVDGAEAIQRFEEARALGTPFTLVIMDLTVPGGMGGREAVARLRAVDPEVRAIVSSGYSSDPVLANYRAHGFCGVVAKPYEVPEFARVLREALGQG
jgi:PAS domain S-box-containing protein